MENIYLIKHLRSSIIYQFDLLGFDSSKDYRHFLECILPDFVRTHPNIKTRLNISIYYLFLYTLSTLSGFNSKNVSYLQLKEEVLGTFSKSLLFDFLTFFKDKYKIIGKSNVVIML